LQENVFEETTLTIESFDTDEDGNMTYSGKEFALNFLKPASSASAGYWQSEKMATNVSAAVLARRIRGFYRAYYNSAITVTRVMYDAEGNVTDGEEDSEPRTKAVFNIKLLKAINGPSTDNIIVSKSGTQANITMQAAAV